MRMHFGTILVVAVCAVCGAALGDDISNTFTYTLETDGSLFTVKTAEELAALPDAVRKAGETVTLASSDETVTETLAAADSEVTDVDLNLKGGTWILSNSRQGSVMFTVRRSLTGNLGAGTEESPAIIVDGDELIDYGVSAPYVFKLDGTDSILNDLRLPAGVRLVPQADGTWHLVASSDGTQYICPDPVTYPIDSAKEGPNRAMRRENVLPVAYTGDNWIGNAAKASTVTFTPPEGSGLEPTTLNLTGTGTRSFDFEKTGAWTVMLTMADGKTLTSKINIIGGMTVILK